MHLSRVDGSTPLHLAARYATPELVRALLERGAAVDARAQNGVTPLHESLWSPVETRRQMVGALLAQRADPDAATADYGITALHMLAEVGDAPLARLLIGAGASVDSRTIFNQTALRVASYYGHARLVELLRAAAIRRASPGLTREREAEGEGGDEEGGEQGGEEGGEEGGATDDGAGTTHTDLSREVPTGATCESLEAMTVDPEETGVASNLSPYSFTPPTPLPYPLPPLTPPLPPTLPPPLPPLYPLPYATVPTATGP